MLIQGALLTLTRGADDADSDALVTLTQMLMCLLTQRHCADSDALVLADSEADVLADSDALVDADSEADVLADSEALDADSRGAC